MKRILVAVLMLFFINLQADDLGNNWVKCVVQFEDGHQESGFIKNFMSVSEAKEFRNYSPNYGMTYGTTRQKVFDKKFKFKTSEDGKAKTIKRNEMVWVELQGDNDVYHFDKMNFKSLSRKGKPTGRESTTFMLLHKKMDKVNVYIKTYQNQDKLLDSPIYFKSIQDDFAVPYFEIKMNVFTLFNKDKINDEVYNSILWVTRDCAEFQNYFQIFRDQNNKKLSEKEKKEMKEEMKKYQGKSMVGQSQLAANGFVKLFEEYHEMCPN